MFHLLIEQVGVTSEGFEVHPRAAGLRSVAAELQEAAAWRISALPITATSPTWLLDIDAAILLGKAPVPQDILLEDYDSQLRPRHATRPGRSIMVPQLEEGMELAQFVKSSDGATLVPMGVVLRSDLIAGLCRLVDQGRIPPLVSGAA